MRKATIKDVARHAGVAPSSISRVLNGHPFVTEALRQRVFAAVEALDYRPSSVARSLRVRRTQLVGMLVRDMVNPNFAVICEAAEAAAQGADTPMPSGSRIVEGTGGGVVGTRDVFDLASGLERQVAGVAQAACLARLARLRSCGSR